MASNRTANAHVYREEDGTPREPTPFERRIDALERFNPASVLLPSDGLCVFCAGDTGGDRPYCAYCHGDEI